MGASESSPLTNVKGFQIGRVLPKSPAHVAGLCPYFDIITGIDDVALDFDGVDYFKECVGRKVGVEVRLTVYNLRVRVYRTVAITPSTNWGGEGLLGCALEWSSAEAALGTTWHIESIDPSGPAGSCADLKAGRDYIIGMQAPDEAVVTLFTNASFAERMEGWRALRRTNTHMPQEERETLLILVFDSVANAVKEVPVHMGNATSLGVEIADGVLHFIPELVIQDASDIGSKLPFVSKFVLKGADTLSQTPDKALPCHAEPQAEVTKMEAVEPALPTAGDNRPPAFPSVLPPHNSAPSYPGALPFPSFTLPPSARPTVQVTQ